MNWENDPELIFRTLVNPNDIHVQEDAPQRLISTEEEGAQIVVNVQEQEHPISNAAEESQDVVIIQQGRSTEEDQTAQELEAFKQGLIKLTPFFEDQHWVERTNAGSN